MRKLGILGLLEILLSPAMAWAQSTSSGQTVPCVAPAQTIQPPNMVVTPPPVTATFPASMVTLSLGGGATLNVPTPSNTQTVQPLTMTVTPLPVVVPSVTTTCTITSTTTTPTPVATTGTLPTLSVQNTGTVASEPQYVTYQQAFVQGVIPAGSGLAATVDSVAVPVQVDVKTTWPDGSANLALVTLQAPAVAAGATVPVTLAVGAAPTGAPVALTSALTGTLTVHSGTTSTPYTIDGAALVKGATKPNYWMQGPLATEARFDVPITGSAHLQVDARVYADGSRVTNLAVRNDIAMGTTGGPLTYDLSAADGAQTVSVTGIKQFQYENWDWTLAATTPLNLVRDVPYYIAAGALLPFNLAAGSSINYTTMPTAAETAPLGSCGITMYMPTTGGRDDIGPTTGTNAAWVYSQTAANQAWSLCKAHAAFGIPWNFYDAGHGGWISVVNYPNLQAEYNQYGTNLTQAVDQTNNGWTPDTAHQPDGFYVPYLFVGDRWMLDGLQAQAAYSVIAPWTGMRNNAIGALPQTNDNVIFGEQLRGGAWSIREIDEAAYASPPSVDQTYLAGVAAHNWAWMAGQIPSLTTLEGQAAGYIIDVNGCGPCIAPWQEAFFTVETAQAMMFGNADAKKVLAWMDGFWTGGVTNLGAFIAENEMPTLVGTTSSNGQIYWSSTANSWAYAATVPTWAGIKSAWTSPPNAQNAVLSALEIESHMLPSASNTAALQAFLGFAIPYTDAKSMQATPNFNFAPGG